MTTFLEFTVGAAYESDRPTSVLLVPDLVFALRTHIESLLGEEHYQVLADCIGSERPLLLWSEPRRYSALEGFDERVADNERLGEQHQRKADAMLTEIAARIDAHRTPWGVTIVREEA